MARLILHWLTMAIILFGLLFGYLHADYNYNPLSLYNKYYYAWDKLICVLMVFCTMFPIKAAKKYWAVIAGFFIVRFIWQAFAIKDYSVASQPSVIFGLFIICVACILIIMILNLLKWK